MRVINDKTGTIKIDRIKEEFDSVDSDVDASIDFIAQQDSLQISITGIMPNKSGVREHVHITPNAVLADAQTDMIEWVTIQMIQGFKGFIRKEKGKENAKHK